MPFNQTGDNATANIGTYNDNTIVHTGSSQEQADIAAIRGLKIASNPGGNQHQTCTANTRVHIRQDIRKWAQDGTTRNQIFWLADRAGTGKSTVAKQIAEDWKSEGKAVASFVFSITAADTKSNAKFCQTVAAELADLWDFRSFRSTLAEALRQNLTVETSGFNEKFEELLCAPLKNTNKPVLIVIDALDECDKKGRFELLAVLFSKLRELPVVKVIITSRPEPDIVSQLTANGLVHPSNLQGSGDVDSTTEDIRRYISNVFANSRRLQRFESYAPELAKKANGVFIYASTACKYLQNSYNPNATLKRLDRIRGLDDLYSQVMERAIPEDDPDSFQAVLSILQVILAAQRPLSVSELQELLKEDLDIESIAGALASVLSGGAQDEPVETYHATFQEYLTDRDRSGVYFVDVKKGHKSLAVGCLETLSKSTATATSLVVAPRAITPILEYAARHWPIHAAVSLKEATAQDDLDDQIVYFFKRFLIHWFELTAKLNAVVQCAKNLSTLEASTSVASATAAVPTSRMYERKRWCRDSRRFLQHHQIGIEQGHNHIRGALAFTPKESLIYKTYFIAFSERIPKVLCGIPTEWPSYQTLSGHTDFVQRVAISQDGTRIISTSCDTTLRLWDGVTGASIGGPMRGHTGVVNNVEFSPDGTRVVSGSSDATLRLWDGVTGASIGGPIRGHTGKVESVAFSPNGTRIISVSHDTTLRLWDGVTGASISGPMRGHTGFVNDVAFSADNSRVVSGSWDFTLRLWDGVTGASIGGPMKGHTGKVLSVAFSPKSTRVVSGSEDFTVRLWDGRTGASIRGPMEGHTSHVEIVAFSPDGTRVISGSCDYKLRLWDGLTGASIGGPMRGHTGVVNDVAFSPDGTRVVSGSGDAILRLWDGVTGASIGEPITGHTGSVNRVAFFPDGTHFVSASRDNTVRLWDVMIGANIHASTSGHTSETTTMSFSSDGTRLVSGSDDRTLRLWDPMTGANIGGPMTGHTKPVTSVVFSPDGTRVVSGSHDKTLRLWDGVTGASIGGPMKGHASYVSSMTFSPDGTRIVSGSGDCTLRLWDGMTGVGIGGSTKGHTWVISSVAFSPDGTRVVSGSWDCTLRLWNAVTGRSIGGPMNEHTEWVNSVAFSPDGTRIVSCSRDYTVRLWDSSRLAQMAVIHTNSILHRAEFSACGSYLFSLGDIWDIRSLLPSLVDRTDPAVSGRSFSRIVYHDESGTIEVHTSSVSTFPVSGCQVRKWVAHRGRLALGLDDGRVVIIDCTHLL